MQLMQNIIFDLKPIKYFYQKSKHNNNLFLDRDGIINEVVIRDNKISSPQKIEEFKLCDDINILNSSFIVDNFNLILITNQPDLSRGIIDLEFIERLNQNILEAIKINMIFICPHTDKSMCECRKPKNGMIEKYFSDNIKGDQNFLVGDQRKDLICAKNSFIPFILKKTKYNKDLEEHSDYAIDGLNKLGNILNDNKKK